MKQPLKYAFMTFSTPLLSLDENLEIASRYGYRGIELRIQSNHAHGVGPELTGQERREVKKKFQDSQTALCCLATSLKFSDTPNREETMDSAGRIITLAADLGTPLIRVFGGSLPEGTSREQSILDTGETLKKVMNAASEAGVTLCFETHDDWCDPRHVRPLMEMVDHPNLAVNWDILHPVRRDFATVEESFELLKPWIAHVHVHDCTFDLKNPKAFTFVPMGEGLVDHQTALSCLVSSGYKGFISGEWINFQPPQIHLPREINRLKQYEEKALTDITG